MTHSLSIQNKPPNGLWIFSRKRTKINAILACSLLRCSRHHHFSKIHTFGLTSKSPNGSSGWDGDSHRRRPRASLHDDRRRFVVMAQNSGFSCIKMTKKIEYHRFQRRLRHYWLRWCQASGAHQVRLSERRCWAQWNLVLRIVKIDIESWGDLDNVKNLWLKSRFCNVWRVSKCQFVEGIIKKRPDLKCNSSKKTGVWAVFRLNFDFTLAAFCLDFGCILPAFYLDFAWILTAFWSNFDWIFAAFWLHFDCILSAFWPNFDCILTEFWLHFDWL